MPIYLLNSWYLVCYNNYNYNYFNLFDTVSVLHDKIWKVMPSVWVFLSCCYWKTSFHFTFTSFKFKVRWILNTKPRNNENKAYMWVENLCYKNFIYFTISLARHKTLIFHATVSNIFYLPPIQHVQVLRWCSGYKTIREARVKNMYKLFFL